MLFQTEPNESQCLFVEINIAKNNLSDEATPMLRLSPWTPAIHILSCFPGSRPYVFFFMKSKLCLQLHNKRASMPFGKLVGDIS